MRAAPLLLALALALPGAAVAAVAVAEPLAAPTASATSQQVQLRTADLLRRRDKISFVPPLLLVVTVGGVVAGAAFLGGAVYYLAGPGKPYRAGFGPKLAVKPWLGKDASGLSVSARF